MTSPYGIIKRQVRGEKAEVRLPIASLVGSVGVSGVWIRVRKPEGERDVGGRRIVCLTGESPVAAAEPAWLWTGAEFELSIVGRENTIRHRGRMVALLFDIVS